MSDQPDNEAAAVETTDAPVDPIAEALSTIITRHGGEVDPMARWGHGFVVPVGSLRAAIDDLRDSAELCLDLLLDITAVDYLAYPNWRDERFGVVYILRSSSTAARVHLKVLVEEDEAEVPSIHDLFKNADWAERETYDQYGITFRGHPNLKRILNHHEFVGHPLRKDYPVQKRQNLSINDPMLDELVKALEARGYEVLDEGLTPTRSGQEDQA